MSFLKQSWVERLKRHTGLDRAIAYTVMARGLQIVGSTGTVLLIVRFLTPVEQGYYYTLLSLVALQTIFELGFSFVILQMAAHESVHLTFHPDGRIEGDPVAHARLASVLQKAVRWYLGAGMALMVVLLPLGIFFFSKHAQTAGEVAWQGPWMFAVIATAVMFTLDPLFSFLEGCGEVRQVAGMRFRQGIAAIVMPWSALIVGHGLYAPGAVNTGYALVGMTFLWSRRKLLMNLLRHRTGGNGIKWRTEVWSFQWQIAVSYLCAYFTTQVLTPILFAYRGPVEAGRMGMSMSIAGYLWVVVLAWMSTKASPFGQLIARGEFETLDRTFFRTLKQSLALLAGLVAVCMAGVIAVQYVYPKLAARMVSPQLFVLLLLTAMSVFVVQSMAIYLRAHKSEPFLWQSVMVAALTCGSALVLVPHWGMMGATTTYFLCTGVVGLIAAGTIFQVKRRARNSLRELQNA